MPTITIAELEALPFGYLTGADLMQFCAPQLLISRYNIDNNSLQRGANFAYSEIIRNFSNRYDVTNELKKTGGDIPDTRENFLVQITAVVAIRKILGNFEKISDELKSNFQWAENSILDIRNGQMNLLLPATAQCQASTAQLVCSKFKTLG